MDCDLCKKFIHEKEVEKYTLTITVELKGGAEVDVTIAIDCTKTPLCMACAVNIARQGLNRLCEAKK